MAGYFQSFFPVQSVDLVDLEVKQMLGRDAFRRFVSAIYMGGCVMCVVVVLRNTVRLFHQELFLSRSRRRLSEERPTSWARASYSSTVSGVKCNYCGSIYTKRDYATVPSKYTKVSTPRPTLQLRTRRPPLLLLLIPQEPSQDLPARTLRDHINELNTACYPLISRLVFLDMLLNLARGYAIILLVADCR
jgi:hypothetical protein